MRRIVVCADDYALAPGVSRAIRELVARGRLNAASVMTAIPGFEAECTQLAGTPSPVPLQIGLHVTLSGGFKPIARSLVATRDGNFPSITRLLPPRGYFGIDQGAVKAEVAAQIAAFRRAFGRGPDFVDGHQHVQLMPRVRHPFLEAVAENAPKAWVRQCGARRGNVRGNKALLLQFLSRRFRNDARRRGIAYSPAFSGAYDFSTKADFATLFARFLYGLPEGGVIMCHPGFVDAELAARDLLTQPREREFAFFASAAFPALLAEAGASLA